jgi:hypothetical protein
MVGKVHNELVLLPDELREYCLLILKPLPWLVFDDDDDEKEEDVTFFCLDEEDRGLGDVGSDSTGVESLAVSSGEDEG